jgi:hypothetical protein
MRGRRDWLVSHMLSLADWLESSYTFTCGPAVDFTCFYLWIGYRPHMLSLPDWPSTSLLPLHLNLADFLTTFPPRRDQHHLCHDRLYHLVHLPISPYRSLPPWRFSKRKQTLVAAVRARGGLHHSTHFKRTTIRLISSPRTTPHNTTHC